MLKIDHLTKTYGEKKAVEDLSLHIHPGEIYGFIGHNGAGKTTTLKSVVGILQFDQGEILIDGKSVQADPLACKRKIAYIPDNPDLYDYMTGIKYLNFIADVFGVSAEDRQARIRKYADLFELTADLAQPIAAYSHGMKQKLAIIAAWLHQPKLIFMDEPFVGLDPKASHLLKEMMRDVCDGGGAIFFSTHVLEVAEKLCDKVAIIKGGKALFISPIVNMEKLIADMMLLANVTEDTLQSKKEIPTAFGETLSWEFLCYVRKHPIKWNIPTCILYGGKDHLTSRETISEFAEKQGADLTVMEDGEHWFHTAEQMQFLDDWIRRSIP